MRPDLNFLKKCIESRRAPRTDGQSGLRILKVLELCQESLKNKNNLPRLLHQEKKNYFVHESSFVDENVEIGDGTKIMMYQFMKV